MKIIPKIRESNESNMACESLIMASDVAKR